MDNPKRVVRGYGCVNRGRKSGTSQWCPLCYANVRGRGSHKGHVAYRTRPIEFVPFERYVMKRPDTKTAGGGISGTGICTDENFAKRYPSILTFLTDDKYDDGGAREVSVLSVSVRETNIALALNDKDLKQSLYTQAETLLEALKLMEGALVGGQGQWRPWKAGKKR